MHPSRTLHLVQELLNLLLGKRWKDLLEVAQWAAQGRVCFDVPEQQCLIRFPIESLLARVGAG